ncbi:hypothetical protein ABG810_07685 [Streptococcus iniae]
MLALERRMQPVKVDEPSVEETLIILKGIQAKYESYHHVKYSQDAIEAADSFIKSLHPRSFLT